MKLNEYQNLNIYSRILETKIDETYVHVLMTKVPADKDFWLSKTGAMLLTIANIFFKDGVKGPQACQLGSIAAITFGALNKTNKENFNIKSEIVKSMNAIKTTFVVTEQHIERMAGLLNTVCGTGIKRPYHA